MADAASAAITGESSPYYMFHPLARQRLAGDLPGVKLIVLLRDPVTRAYSGHSHELARGFEDLPFEEALAAEPERLAGEREKLMADPGYDSLHWQHHAYVTRGQYIEQLRAVEQLVGRERMCVVDSGDFFTDPEPVFDEVREFLGLAPCPDIALRAAQRAVPVPAVRRAAYPPRGPLLAVRRRARRMVGAHPFLAADGHVKRRPGAPLILYVLHHPFRLVENVCEADSSPRTTWKHTGAAQRPSPRKTAATALLAALVVTLTTIVISPANASGHNRSAQSQAREAGATAQRATGAE